MEQKNNWVIWKYLSLIRNTELILEMQTWSHFLTAKKKKKRKKEKKSTILGYRERILSQKYMCDSQYVVGVCLLVLAYIILLKW